MSGARERTSGTLRTLLVLGAHQRIWTKDSFLPIPPFPGLGIRIDVYDMLNVVGDPGYDVTCICTAEGGVLYSEEQLRGFGFEPGDYP